MVCASHKGFEDCRERFRFRGDYYACAFWAQQAAEKALKALLISRGKVLKTHDLIELSYAVSYPTLKGGVSCFIAPPCP